MKDAVDHVGTGSDVGGSVLTFSGKQYEPYYEESHATVSSDAIKNQNIANNGAVNNNGILEETKKQTGSNNIVKSPSLAD